MQKMYYRISEVQYYENQEKKLEREISDLWEIGKKSKTKERRLEEIKLIIIGIESKKIIEEELRKVKYYERLLEQNHISYLH